MLYIKLRKNCDIYTFRLYRLYMIYCNGCTTYMYIYINTSRILPALYMCINIKFYRFKLYDKKSQIYYKILHNYNRSLLYYE